MENSGIQKEIIDLGILLVKELELEDSVDTLGRWMAHYVAEKITAAKSAEESVRPIAEAECAKAILDLWNHRWALMERHQPLKDFTRLLEFLRQIDPKNFDPYFYRVAPEKKLEEDNIWLKAARDIDKAARVCLKFMLAKAAESASSVETKSILEKAIEISPDPDIMVIQTLLENTNYHLAPFDLEHIDEVKTDLINDAKKSQIDYLDKLIKHAEDLKAELKDDLI